MSRSDWLGEVIGENGCGNEEVTEPDREEVNLVEPEALLRRLSVTLAERSDVGAETKTDVLCGTGTDVEARKATDVEALTGIDVVD